MGKTYLSGLWMARQLLLKGINVGYTGTLLKNTTIRNGRKKGLHRYLDRVAVMSTGGGMQGTSKY